MSWISELCDLYEKNQKIAGKYEKNAFGTDLILLPVFHTTVTAQITVTLDEEGHFLRAETVADEDKLTIIPVTEKSAARTSGVEPHPLCDNLKYLAGDYMYYVTSEKGKNFLVNYEEYMNGLKQWANAEQSHEKVKSIYKYLQKNSLMKDLIAAGCLKTDGNGKVDTKVKIQNVAQTDAFVRFRVERLFDPADSRLEQADAYIPEECWKDGTLQEAYIAYCKATGNRKGISYLTGEETQISYLHPKKIRNEGDGAKLISSNDETNFTFRGRFQNKEEAFAIGYEDSQKAHNALKWIIRKQGKSWNNSLCVVMWESDLHELPDWSADSAHICESFEEMDLFGDPLEKEKYEGTNPADAAKLQMAIAGYAKKLDFHSQMFLLALDAATTGRLAIVENEALSTSNYLKNLKKWHRDCGWLHAKSKDKAFYGAVSVKDTTKLLYGNDQGGLFSLKGSSEKMESEVCKRLIPCILQGKPLPEDLVYLAVRRASSPVSYENWFNWERVLTLACSFVKKHKIEQGEKEEWDVALKEDCDNRSYLYGRLLAVADRMEYRSFEKEEIRETNAKRYMSMFSQQPFRTWKIIEERARIYLPKLRLSERLRYEHLLEEICWLFKDGEFEKNDALDGLYLLGFHNQSLELRKWKIKEEEE